MLNITLEPVPDVTRLWQTLRQEARAIAQTEPILAPILRRTLLDRGTLQDALAHRLASHLATAEMDAVACQALLSEGFDEDPAIVLQSARDLIAICSNDPACRTHIHAYLNYKGFHAVQVHRIAHHLWANCRRDLATWLSNRASAAFGPDIHPAARFGAGIMLDHGSGIVIGETAEVEDDVTILQNVTLGGTGKIQGDRHPKVRQGAMIGAGANVIGNIEIGAFSKVGAGSVVLKNVPPGCTVAGVPAQIVRLHPATELSTDAPGQQLYS